MQGKRQEKLPRAELGADRMVLGGPGKGRLPRAELGLGAPG
jgi:hypothetical protein